MSSATQNQIPDNAILDKFNRQVYLGNAYTFVLPITVSGTSEVAQLLLVNPAVNGTVYKSLFVNLRRVTGLTAAVNTIVNTYLNPTVSAAGTSKTPSNARPGYSNTSVGVLTSAPTVSPNGTLVENITAGPLSSGSSDYLFMLDPGNSLLLTVTSANAANVDLQLSWYDL